MRTSSENSGARGVGRFPAAMLLLLVAAAAGGQENGPELYGYLEGRTDGLCFSDGPEGKQYYSGAGLKLRLKGDWQPEERVAFHVEGQWTGSLGADHPDFTSKRLGLDELPSWVPGETDEFSLDHAWGFIDMGGFDLQAGKLPIAWGTGYVFNPTARVNPSAGMDPGSGEETPGIIGLSSSIYPSYSLTISGYLAFQDRGRNAPADLTAADLNDLPWGLRLRTYLGPFDVSLGALREVTYDPFVETFSRPLWVSFDGVGNLMNINLYWEGALRTTDFDGGPPESDWSIGTALEAIAGLHAIPGFAEGVEIRGEYYYHGAGELDEDSYNVGPVLAGTSEVMGRHYLFSYAEKRFCDYHMISLGVLTNLGDFSGAVFPEYKRQITANYEFALGAVLYFGTGEFEGLIDRSEAGPGGSGIVDMAGYKAYALVKVSF